MLLPFPKLAFVALVAVVAALIVVALGAFFGRRSASDGRALWRVVAVVAFLGGGYLAARYGRAVMIVRRGAGDLEIDSRAAIGSASYTAVDGASVAIVSGTVTGIVIVNATPVDLELSEVCFGVPSFEGPIVIVSHSSFAADGATRPMWIGKSDGPPTKGSYGCRRWLHESR